MKLKTFFTTWLTLLTTPENYWKLIQTPISHIMWFFVISALLLSSSSLIHFETQLMPILKSEIDQTYYQVLNRYPHELEITWDGQKLSSNYHQPLAIPYPEIIKAETWGLPPYLSYLVLTTNDLSEVPDTVKSSSWSVVTAGQVFIHDRNQNWSQLPLTAVLESESSWVLNYQTLPDIATKVKTQVVGFGRFISQAAWIIIPMFYVLGRLLQAALEMVLIYFLAKLQKPDFKLVTAWKLSLFITLVASLLEQLAIWLYPNLHFPLFSLTFWCVAFLVFWAGRK